MAAASDMTGCVRLFLAIDPKAWAIQTYSGGRKDTSYRKNNRGGWRLAEKSS